MNPDRVYLLLLSGELQDANRFIATRYPGCENVPISTRQLREGGWRGQIKAFRALRGKALIFFTQSLSDLAEPQLTIWSAVLHRCRFTVLADSSGSTVMNSRWTLIRLLPRAIASAVADLFVFLAAWCFMRAIPAKSSAGRVQWRPSADLDLAYLYPFPLDRSIAGGALSHVTGFLGGLASAGTRCEVFSGRSLPIRQFPIHLIPATRRLFLFSESKLLSYNVRLALAVRRRLRHRRTGVIYQRHGRFVIAGALLSLFTRLPLVLEYNGSEAWVADHWDPARFRSWLGMCEELSLARADLIVVVSEALKQELLRRGIPEERILLNPNAVDPALFQPSPDRCQDVRKQLGFATSDIVVGFVGTFHYWHGVHVLERAIQQLLQDEATAGKLRFLLVGDGLLRAEMKNLLESYASGRVIFTGLVPHEQIVGYLDATDILVSPHLPMPDGQPFFGSPTKIFEYMAMGKGIISSSLDQLSSVLTHGKNAWLVEPGNANELASAIILLADNPVLRKQLGQCARLTAMAEHTWRQNAERVLARVPIWSHSNRRDPSRPESLSE